ncbi:MAG: CapA family protein [Polyangia bacterium]
MKLVVGLAVLVAYVVLTTALAHVLTWPVAVAAAPPTIERPPARPGHARLLFLGDTGLGDRAQALLDARGYDAPFERTRWLVESADVAVANLEMPITEHRRRFAMYKRWRYASSPRAALALASAGLDVVTLANNHSTDQDDEGLFDTLRLSRAAGLEPMGAGSNEEEARRGLVIRVGDVNVGVLAYCERQLWWEVWDDQFARRSRPGVAALTDAGLAADIARLRPLVDVLVVTLHIGYNYEAPTEDTLRWSRRAIDLGADLVVDHHPHSSHPIALHRGRPIALSLGNFVFGTPGHRELDVGQMLFVELDGKRLARLEVLPLDVQNNRVAFVPRPLVGAPLDAALSSLIRESAAYGAAMHREADRAVLELAP